METEFEYLRVEVTRQESTDLYLKVPKGWRPTGRNSKLMGQAAKETANNDSDWDKHGWEHTVEVQGHKVVEEEVARLYEVFEVKEEPK